MDKKAALAYLDADFKQHPNTYYYEGELNCTYAGEVLQDHCGVSYDDAYDWAFDWAEKIEATLAVA